MPRSGPKSLAEIIDQPGSALAQLAERAQAQGQLTARVRASLAVLLAAHVASCSLEPDGTLVVVADSGPWAARLRYEEQQLLSHCREIHPEIQRIRVRVLRTGEALS